MYLLRTPNLVSIACCSLSFLINYGFAIATPPSSDQVKRIESWFEKHSGPLVENYQHLHRHPEVSFAEKQTAEYVARLWQKAGFEVNEHVGGHGIVGVLKNGDGPTVMLRTDLDALPVTEKTGLPYASTVETRTEDGTPTGVMHACGHDLHMTVVTGSAQFLSDNKKLWKGTLLLIGQPAEERGSGALAMLRDGLFTRFPKPDYALALHVESSTPAGSIAVRGGYILANVDSVDIEVQGRGGHGASPESTIDPIVQAAELVMSIQTIVSREIKPTEPAVVTVGSIHGGTKHNIIGDRCTLQITVRSYTPEVRQKILASIKRRAFGIASAYSAPEPTIKISEGTPALENNQALADRLTKVFKQSLGDSRVLPGEQVMGGEDFSQYGLAGVPILMYRLGVIAPERLDRFRKLNETPPSLHSPAFYPDLEGSLETGIISMSSATIDLLSP
ncbi:MAG: amidohydrolase [Planctomycetota bacterium]|nr:amidohydrolase [Planctomycetota bacterium]